MANEQTTIEHRSWYRYSVGVRKARQYPRVIYIYLPRERVAVELPFASLPRHARISTRHCRGTEVYRRSLAYSSDLLRVWRSRRGSKKKRKKWKRRFESTIGGLTPITRKMVFEGDSCRFSCSSEVIRGT